MARTGDGTHRYSKEELKNKTRKELQDLNNNMIMKVTSENHDEDDQKYEKIDNLWGWGKSRYATCHTLGVLTFYFSIFRWSRHGSRRATGCQNIEA